MRCKRDPDWAANEIERLETKANRTCEYKLIPNQHWLAECGYMKNLPSSPYRYCPSCGGRIKGKDVEEDRIRQRELMERYLEVHPEHREEYEKHLEKMEQ
jgi:hypothetical protein